MHYYSNYDIISGEDKAEALKTKLKPSAPANIRELILDNLRIFAEALKPKLQPKLKTTCLEAFFIDYTPPPNLQLYVVLKQLISSLVLIELSVNKVVLLVTTFLSFQITQYL